MTQEDKELLLKDLCSRLSYGIIVYRISDNSTHGFVHSDIVENIDAFSHFLEYSGIDDIKPYLRPMSSMTEEEKRDFPFPYYFEWIDSNFSLLCSNDEVCASIGFSEMYEIMDWLNAHHFDYRGLIKKGLAIEVIEENNPYKE